ncbi:hypothetical protein ACJJTC_011796 [Scirpophaga incertulas]
MEYEETVTSTRSTLVSQFSDAECGEPVTHQQLVIDFTPTPGVDDAEELLDKCVELWKLIDEHFKNEAVSDSEVKVRDNEIHNLMHSISCRFFSTKAKLIRRK